MPAKKPAPKVHLGAGGRAAAVQTGTSDREVAEALTGVDQLPEKGMELGRAPARPEFDPHAERNSIIEGAEVAVQPIISTVVFVGVDDGSYEERLRAVLAYAEGKELINLTATVGALDPDVYDAIIDG